MEKKNAYELYHAGEEITQLVREFAILRWKSSLFIHFFKKLENKNMDRVKGPQNFSLLLWNFRRTEDFEDFVGDIEVLQDIIKKK